MPAPVPKRDRENPARSSGNPDDIGKEAHPWNDVTSSRAAR